MALSLSVVRSYQLLRSRGATNVTVQARIRTGLSPWGMRLLSKIKSRKRRGEAWLVGCGAGGAARWHILLEKLLNFPDEFSLWIFNRGIMLGRRLLE